MLIAVLSLVVVLGVLVFVHEAGHFVAAKWAGIYVHRFSLGFGAPIRWLSFRRGETEYAVSWLPLGGYVKMASQEEEATTSALEGPAAAAEVPPDRVFEAKPIWKRMIVILAGVTMNALFAYVVYTGLAWANGETLTPVTRVGAVIPELLPPGAEALRQLQPGDRIVAVGGQPVSSWEDVTERLVTAAGTGVSIGLADGRTVRVAVHADALGRRMELAQAVQPWFTPVVGQLQDGSPAARAGLAPGDTLTSVDGQPLAQWYQLQQILDSTEGKPVAIGYRRSGAERTVEITPRVDTVDWYDSTRHAVGRLGVILSTPTVSRPYSFGQALGAGGRATLLASTQIIRGVRGLLSGRVPGRTLGGPILIAQQAGQQAQLGIQPFLAFMALISVNLAVLNLLPIPVLDGGQFLFLTAEAVIRRPLPLRLRERLTTVGLLLILALMLYAFSNDILRLLGR